MREEKWESRIKKFKTSGKSQRVWCQEQGIKRSTLRYWLSRTDELAISFIHDNRKMSKFIC